MKQNNSQIKGWAVALTIFLIIALAIVGCVFNNSFVKKTDDHSVQKENSDNTTTTVSVPTDANDTIIGKETPSSDAAHPTSKEQPARRSNDKSKHDTPQKGIFVEDNDGQVIYIEENQGDINFTPQPKK